jgi:hypothetical protein
MSWGLCRDCKWWQIEPGAPIADQTLGLCIDEEILKFRVRISGNGGCINFMRGEPARAEGSASAPPTAEATR